MLNDRQEIQKAPLGYTLGTCGTSSRVLGDHVAQKGSLVDDTSPAF
ncbi:MAG: hypothetical protein U5J95_05725 [Balneolaceae bacterium]|nr:hypothetical protein [Balneolaceae bacterium]